MPQRVFEAPTIGRAAAVIGAINDDAANPAHGVSAEKVEQFYDANSDPAGELIKQLWTEPANQTEVQNFLHNKLAENCSKDTDKKYWKNFKYLQVQDYLWLRDWVQFKALRIASIPQDDYDVDHYDTLLEEVMRLQDSADLVDQTLEFDTQKLEIKSSELNNAIPGVAELAYGNFLQNHSARIDWLFLLLTFQGWYKLAEHYEGKNKEGYFHKYWVELNKDRSSAVKLSSFLDANKSSWESNIKKDIVAVNEKGDFIDKDRVGSLKDEQGNIVDKGHKWNKLLRTALRLETAMFNEAWNSLK